MSSWKIIKGIVTSGQVSGSLGMSVAVLNAAKLVNALGENIDDFDGCVKEINSDSDAVSACQDIGKIEQLIEIGVLCKGKDVW